MGGSLKSKGDALPPRSLYCLAEITGCDNWENDDVIH